MSLKADEIEHLHIKEITLLSLILVAVVSAVTYSTGNIEFTYYAIGVLPFLALFYFAHKKLHLSVNLFILAFIFGFLHLIGGASGLYEMSFRGFGYDTLTHFYGGFVLSLIAYNFVINHLVKVEDMGKFLLFLVILLITLGTGALVEIIEFGAVLILPATNVGNYFNNAMDLVMDGFGGGVGALFMIYLHRKRK